MCGQKACSCCFIRHACDEPDRSLVSKCFFELFFHIRLDPVTGKNPDVHPRDNSNDVLLFSTERIYAYVFFDFDAEVVDFVNWKV